MKHIADIKHKNKKDIIRLLYKKHNLSKKRIALELSLSPSVLTKLCNELLEEGIIIETEPIKTEKAGRKEMQITINPHFKSCIGVIMNHRSTTILLTDMELKIIDQVKFSTSADPDSHLETLFISLCKLIDQHSVDKEQILGIGISIKGNTDGDFAYYGIWERKVDVRKYLEDKIDIPVALDNGIRCSALLEQLHSTEENFIFIKYMEPGLGGAVVQDGQIRTGQTHNILDFGHLIIDPSGDYCPVCKRKGCLESYISFEKIIEYASDHFSQNFSPVLWNLCHGDRTQITISRIIEAVEGGCIQLNKLFKRNAGYLAMCLINTYALLDIGKIIMIGELFSSTRFQSYFKAAVYDYQLTPIYQDIEFHIHENVLLSAPVLALNKFLFQ